MGWSHLDPVGVTESVFRLAAYDPLGNYAGLPEPPPQTGPWPQPGGYYGPIWGGAGSSFSNVNNFSSGCTLDGRPADCNRVRQSLSNKAVGEDPNATLPWTPNLRDHTLPLPGVSCNSIQTPTVYPVKSSTTVGPQSRRTLQGRG